MDDVPSHGCDDKVDFDGSYWQNVAQTKRAIKFLRKELAKKTRLLAVYYEGVKQYLEEDDFGDDFECGAQAGAGPDLNEGTHGLLEDHNSNV